MSNRQTNGWDVLNENAFLVFIIVITLLTSLPLMCNKEKNDTLHQTRITNSNN